jgi:type IV pilus assembly protein PilV
MKTQPDVEIPDKEREGFTLLEVLIAIVILTVGLLGMASLTVGIINGNKFSNDTTTATTLAQDRFEDIQIMDYSGVTSETKAVLASPNDAYKQEVTVTDGSPATGMKTVTIKVYWGGSSKEDHNVEIKTILRE